MGTIELRKKWVQSITQVDGRFLRMIDDLYKNYTENKADFFDEVPMEIQDLILQSKEDIKQGRFRTHEDVMAEFRKKYSISE